TISWQDAALEKLDIKAAETIDIKLGSGQDSGIIFRPIENAALSAANTWTQKIVFQSGSTTPGRPGDRASDLIRIIGFRESADTGAGSSVNLNDRITSTASTADGSIYNVFGNTNDGPALGKVVQTIELREHNRAGLEEDSLRIETGDGDDDISLAGQRMAAGSAGGLVRYVLAGGGNDTLAGSNRDEIFDLGAGDDVVTPGLGDDVFIDGGGRDTLIFDADTTGLPGAVTYELSGDELVIRQSGDVQREYLWDIEVLQLRGTSGDDRFNIRDFKGRADLDGRDGSDAYIDRANDGVSRFGVETGSSNIVYLADDAALSDGDLLVGADIATLQLDLSGTGFETAVTEGVSVVRGTKSGAIATALAYSQTTGRFVLGDLTGVPEHGERFEIIGKAAVAAPKVSLTAGDLRGATLDSLVSVGDLLTAPAVLTDTGATVPDTGFTSASGKVTLKISGLSYTFPSDVDDENPLTLRREFAGDSYQTLGKILSWDDTDKLMSVELDAGITLAKGDDLAIGGDYDTPVLPDDTGLEVLTDAHQIIRASDGEVTVEYTLANQEIFAGATVYGETLEGDVSEIGRVVAFDDADDSLQIALNASAILKTGEELRIEVTPHTVLRVETVDAELGSLTGSLLSGTIRAASDDPERQDETAVSLTVDGTSTVVPVIIRNTETHAGQTLIRVEKDTAARSIGDLLTGDGATALYRVVETRGDTMQLAVLEGRWISSQSDNAALASIESAYREPLRTLARATLDFVLLPEVDTANTPAAGQIWRFTSDEINALIRVVSLADNKLTFDLLDGRIGTGVADRSLDEAGPGIYGITG
ncbi:MAG: hypothetical protein P8Q89_02015, partial [Alphaproteobacteria bacterium]|nr:hypothetical protein [Alphaproteobacteria bacterium]